MWLVSVIFCFVLVFFFKQKTAYEMRISDWSSDVCSSDLDSRDTLAEADAAPFGKGALGIGLGVILRHILGPVARQGANKLTPILEVIAAIMERHAVTMKIGRAHV